MSDPHPEDIQDEGLDINYLQLIAKINSACNSESENTTQQFAFSHERSFIMTEACYLNALKIYNVGCSFCINVSINVVRSSSELLTLFNLPLIVKYFFNNEALRINT